MPDGGIYDIIACLAVMLGDYEILHMPTEGWLAGQCCSDGPRVSLTGKPNISTDWISIYGHVAMNISLHEVIWVKAT